MGFAVASYAGTELTVCRTGYTGEHGYELVVPAEPAGAVWDALAQAGTAYGLRPAGLAARDTLRTEMGYPLHGQDLSPQISPVQARAGWAVGWGKPRVLGPGRAAGGEGGRAAPGAVGPGGPGPGDSALPHGGAARRRRDRRGHQRYVLADEAGRHRAGAAVHRATVASSRATRSRSTSAAGARSCGWSSRRSSRHRCARRPRPPSSSSTPRRCRPGRAQPPSRPPTRYPRRPVARSGSWGGRRRRRRWWPGCVTGRARR